MGLASEHINGKLLRRRLQTFSCELLRRPSVGVSQFAATIAENTNRIQDHYQKCFTSYNLNKYVDLLKSIACISDKLNARGPEFHRRNVATNLKHLLKIIFGRDGTLMKSEWKLIRPFMHLGASMFSLGLHLLVFHLWSTTFSFVARKVIKGNVYNRMYKRWAKTRRPNLKNLVQVAEQEYRNIRKSDFSISDKMRMTVTVTMTPWIHSPQIWT